MEYSIGSGDSIEYSNRIFYRIIGSIEYSTGFRIFYSIFYRIL